MRLNRAMIVGCLSPAAAVVIALAFGTAMHSPVVRSAAAQSNPSATRYMYDSRPNNGAPPTFPGQSSGPQAYVVEGLGASQGNCSNTNFTEAKIRDQAVSWLNGSHNTIIEITPQKDCASLATYEGLIDRLVDYVEGHTSNASTRFGGIMLDEEPGYKFSVSDLEALNDHVHDKMYAEPGISWYFTEDQPNGWGLSTYDAIIGFSTPTPQVYTTSMLNAVNADCTQLDNCLNVVTVPLSSSFAPYNDPSYTLPRVTGVAWSVAYSEWGGWSIGWWNAYRNQ
jgi:hypothetical protein